MTRYMDWHGMRVAIPEPKKQPGSCGAQAETPLAGPSGEAGAPNLPNTDGVALTHDEAQVLLKQCLDGMRGPPKDDKALIAQLHERGLWVYRVDGFHKSRLAWHIGDNLRWLAEQSERPAYVPCGMLTGAFLTAVADKLSPTVTVEMREAVRSSSDWLSDLSDGEQKEAA